MITPYLTQLQTIADDLGVALQDAIDAEGIAPSTVMRWRRGTHSCLEGTARKVADRLTTIAQRRAVEK